MATRRITRSASREPGTSRAAPRLKSKKVAALETVIDLTLSDDDDELSPVAGPSRARAKAFAQPADEARVLVERNEPGRPARTGFRVLAELNVLDKENEVDLRHVVPARAQQPLFLPDDDDDDDDDGGHIRQDPALPAPQFDPVQLEAELQNHAVQPPLQPVLPAQPIEPADALAQVLEIVPDVDPAHAQKLIDAHIGTYGADKVVQPVLHLLLEDPAYPKVQKGKRKANDSAAANAPKRAKIDYASVDRPFTGGAGYFDAALMQLTLDYPYIPLPTVRRFLLERKMLYAPTFLFLREQEKKPVLERPYNVKKTPTNKGKGRAFAIEDPELAKEVQWAKEYVDGNVNAPAEDEGEGSLEAPEGEGVECGCCFGEYQFDTMIQCPDAHLFCLACVRSYAGTKLADGHADVPCPSGGDPPCKMMFSESELRRALKDKQMELWHRVRARRDLEAAGLDGLEECPFCEYACVVENGAEKLFRCARDECGEVSCRACKRRDHLPKSCKEADEDNVLDAQHAVEEAMTKALMRNCPKCAKAFVKEAGCNKMTCPYCHTLSCYVCRQVIVGYDHFDQMPGGQRRPSGSKAGKCALWDQNVEVRHHEEVEAAAKRALAEVRAANPEVDAAAIKVDVPAAPPPAPVPAHPAPPIGLFNLPAPGPGWLRAPPALGFFAHLPPPPPAQPAYPRFHPVGEFEDDFDDDDDGYEDEEEFLAEMGRAQARAAAQVQAHAQAQLQLQAQAQARAAERARLRLQAQAERLRRRAEMLHLQADRVQPQPQPRWR